jgi:hypothetical protein
MNSLSEGVCVDMPVITGGDRNVRLLLLTTGAPELLGSVNCTETAPLSPLDGK